MVEVIHRSPILFDQVSEDVPATKISKDRVFPPVLDALHKIQVLPGPLSKRTGPEDGLAVVKDYGIVLSPRKPQVAAPVPIRPVLIPKPCACCVEEEQSIS